MTIITLKADEINSISNYLLSAAKMFRDYDKQLRDMNQHDLAVTFAQQDKDARRLSELFNDARSAELSMTSERG